MKPDMDRVVRWAQESGMKLGRHEGSEHFYWEGGEFVPTEKLMRLVALAYEAGARAEREKLRRGEYICGKCGLRQDAKDQPPPSF